MVRPSVRALTQLLTISCHYIMSLEKSTAYSTLLTPLLGYDKVNKIVSKKIATGKTIREVVIEDCILTADEFDQLIHQYY